ncbi:retropepsin-like aspartic protease family protein [Kamptonema formosum]|uniref:retropepsin-like aspartic protease family protein n=1 Tax=Kamptonema formosum TaxID=331992 RepID=UPI00034786E9|nr:retropepsin-like aspartic protease [Oscillatoria sp. PCC 10802]
MRNQLTALIYLTGISLAGTAAMAQEYEGCFLIDKKGNVVQLTKLCPNNARPVVPTTAPGMVQAPIKRRDGGTPVIDVVFNGNQTFEMLLDTGATGTAITPKMAQALGVRPEGVMRVDTASDTGLQVPLGHVASIQVGAAVIQNVPVTILPKLEIGLLGQNFFSRYEVTIKKDVVEFREPSSGVTVQK